MRSDAEVALAVSAAHAELCAVQRRLLAEVAEHDRRQAWRAQGATCEAKFLQACLGLGWRTANAWVRVAHALDRRPRLADAFCSGAVSFDHVVGVVDVAAAEDADVVAPAGPFDDQPGSGDALGGGDGEGAGGTASDGADPCDAPDDSGSAGAEPGATGGAEARGDDSSDGGASGAGVSDDDLVDLANRMTPAQLAAMARRLRHRSADEAAAAHRRRRVDAWLDAEAGHLRASVNLFDLQASRVWAALIDYANSCGADPASGTFDPLEARFADALDAMATAYLEGRSHISERPAIIVHADATVAEGGEGWAETSTGVRLASETVRRLLCFCELTGVETGPGDRLRLGRTKRTPTWQLAAMVRRRDGGCRFPGCNRTLWVQVHHIKEWTADLGPTDYENLISLCTYHHHLVHEGGWSMRGDACGEVAFRDRLGAVELTSWADPCRGPTHAAAPPGRPPTMPANGDPPLVPGDARLPLADDEQAQLFGMPQGELRPAGC